MRCVIDTNIFLVAISQKSPYHWVFQSLVEGKYRLCLSQEILLEYEEIIGQHMAKVVAEFTQNFLVESPHVEMTTIYFKWNFLINDPDDDKFADCYLASGSELLVSHDKGFNFLKNLTFPKFKVVSASEFKEILGLS